VELNWVAKLLKIVEMVFANVRLAAVITNAISEMTKAYSKISWPSSCDIK
jgi:hypothetical protein